MLWCIMFDPAGTAKHIWSFPTANLHIYESNSAYPESSLRNIEIKTLGNDSLSNVPKSLFC